MRDRRVNDGFDNGVIIGVPVGMLMCGAIMFVLSHWMIMGACLALGWCWACLASSDSLCQRFMSEAVDLGYAEVYNDKDNGERFRWIDEEEENDEFRKHHVH